MNFNFLRRPYLAAFATLLVSVLLFSPAVDLPDETPGWINDKVAHLLVFAGLSFLWSLVWRNTGKTALFMVCYAVGTEVVQYLLPDSFQRSFDAADIAADLAGSSLGILLAFWWVRWMGRDA